MRTVILAMLMFAIGNISAQDKIGNQKKENFVIPSIVSKTLNQTNKKRDIKNEQQEVKTKPAPQKKPSPKGKRFNTGGGQFNYTALYTNENEQGKYANSGGIKTPQPHNNYDVKMALPSKFVTRNIYENDSAYYAKIVKKHGWWIGVGRKMTLKEVSHLNSYFKLSKKNQAGNWTYIEAFDGYGVPTTYHNIGTYLANQYDDEDKGLNSEWRGKLQSVCKWEMVADASGKEVVQERALDADGDVIYIYSPVKIGEREYTGSFTDSWGMPIFMRSDSLGNDAGYANFVHITRDERGFEVLYSYTDRFGYPQKNKDGAYMTKREYDDMGNHIKEASMNIVGDYMIDDYGNCGWESTYSSLGHQLSARYFDASWKPMRMPNLRGGNGEVFGFRFERDKYGRDTAVVVIDAMGNPDVNEFGVHKMIKRYNEHGRQTYFANYDKEGKLIAGDNQGIAKAIWDFNKSGDVTLIEYKDANGNYINGADGYCKSVYEYDNDGINFAQTNYKVLSSNELTPVFVFSRDKIGNRVKKWPLDNQVRIDSVDSKGRNILVAWYNLDGIPIEYEGMHKHITEYDDDKNTETETWLDKDGNPFVDDDRGYSKDVTIRDNANNRRTIYQYWYGGLLKQAYQQQFDPNSKIVTKQWDVTPYGEHARVGWYNNLHYTCDVDYTMYGKIRTMVGRNEFDEPSYLTFLGDSEEVYYFSDLNNGHRRYYDEYGNEIPDSMMAEFKKNLPKVFCVEVTDTTIAYPLGLRNGDIIISYGDWITEKDLNSNVDYFYLEAILKANQEKQITLLRHHPEKISSEILHRNLPKGRTSDLGFYPHKIYYTQKEKARLLNTSNKYGILLNQNQMQRDSTILLAVQTKGGFEQTRLYHLPTYNVKDPGIVLYAKEKYSKGVDTWSMHNSIEQWDRQHMFRIKGANLYITQDCSTTRHIEKQSSGLGGMTFVPIRVSMETFNILNDCYQMLGDSITESDNNLSSKTQSVLNVKRKQLIGKWKNTGSEDNVNYVLTMELAKDGSSTFSIDAIIEGEIQSGVTLRMGLSSKALSGLWTLDGQRIRLDFSDSKSEVKITDLDIIGVDDESKPAMMEELRNMIEQKKEDLTRNLEVSKLIEKEDYVIIGISSNDILLMVDGTEMTFSKSK